MSMGNSHKLEDSNDRQHWAYMTVMKKEKVGRKVLDFRSENGELQVVRKGRRHRAGKLLLSCSGDNGTQWAVLLC